MRVRRRNLCRVHPLLTKINAGLDPQQMYDLGVAAGDQMTPTAEMVLTHLVDGKIKVDEACALLHAHAQGATITPLEST
jgi:hypothetical protein